MPVDIPDDLKRRLVGEAGMHGKLLPVEKYLELLSKQESGRLRDFPVVDRKLEIVISEPFSHAVNIALLGKCHELLAAESLLRTGGDFWQKQFNIVAGNAEENDRLCGVFIQSGGYFFSMAEFIHPICVCARRKEFDVVDNVIIRALRCRKFDYPYD